MRINGKTISLKEEIKLSDFLEQNGYNINRVAVEKNGNIIPRAKFLTEIINDNDIIEVVSFVGGG